ncbi:MAG: peptide ABC transporter substrate-binding protein [Chloroflexi bacterium]|nr:peptide ABC transporter substrate-binding protein [Chloroflexota bacterium]
MSNPKFRFVGILALFITLFILVQCAPAPTATPAPVAPTTAPAAPKPAATAAPPAPTRGGTITMAVWQEPSLLNPALGSQTVLGEVDIFVVEGLTDTDDKGNSFNRLAAEVPTTQNGGVSPDGKTVTYKLRQGVKFHDGSPFTCEDVQFTFTAVSSTTNGSVGASRYKDVDSVTCPDPFTAVVKFKNFYAPYATLFGYIFPKNSGKTEDMKNWAYNRKPVGTGPFKVDEFVTGDHVTLLRNENYWQTGKPYLDKVIIRIVPSSEVAKQLIKNGEADVMWNNSEADIPEVEKMTGVKLSSAARSGGERLILNLVKPGDPADNKTPHPILGDLRVRQAIAYGVDKKTIIDKLLNGKALPGSSDLNVDPYNCTDIKAFPYDAAKAKQLLDDAGWKPGADGIRVKDGNRLKLKYQTTTGNKLREDSQVLIVENMKAIGVEFFIENQPSALLLGTWDNASPRKRGSYDIVMYTTTPDIDPHNFMVTYFGSTSIPSPDNQGGINYSRWNDSETDKLIAQAGGIPDWPARKDLYCKAAARVVEGASHIYLYQRLKLDSYRDRLQGWVPNGWNNDGWNAENWWLKTTTP